MTAILLPSPAVITKKSGHRLDKNWSEDDEHVSSEHTKKYTHKMQHD
jgi:hypothetical protein